eukprot:TRINITY_DN8289_c0_g1_i1.p1 TRINITY_DN8289_c0_g1~~TRINITY_DN8289_c0_g1_i1.p1  ORF type:complete len:671 (+),score=227.03 TRINITY_DN8289_c0_g1_i1:50-2014(+)
MANRESVSEEDVGISKYLNTADGFSGIIKFKQHDFSVNEVGLDGKVVRMESGLINAPVPEVSEEEKLAKSLTFESLLDTEHQGNKWANELISIAGFDKDSFFAFLEKAKDSKDVDFQFSAPSEKETRTAIHKFVKAKLGKLLTTDTVMNKDGPTMFRFRVRTFQTDRERSDSHNPYPRDQPPYVRCTMVKENIDTMSAINKLQKFLHIGQNRIFYAGTKDKRAVTTQKIDIFKIAPERLRVLQKGLRDIQLGDCEFVKNNMMLGDLKGNRFTIVLRNVSESEEKIVEAINAWRESGFINYFGLQRFGSGTVATHEIGCALFKRDFEGAINMILKPQVGQSDEVRAVLEKYQNDKDAASAEKNIPSYMHVEKSLLGGLANSNNDNPVGALSRVNRTTRMLYLHAYQSYVFNHLASYRVEKHGLKIVEGDLVLDKVAMAAAQREQEARNSRGRGRGRRGKKGNNRPMRPVEIARVVTADDIESNKYTIADIVLPLCGSQTVLPTFEGASDMMNNLMEKDGLNPSEMPTSGPRDYCVNGAYRSMLSMPHDVEYEFKSYVDAELPLVQTDMMRATDTPIPAQPNTPEVTPLKALVVGFTLVGGSIFATMALRELMKEDTHVNRLMELNKKQKDEQKTEETLVTEEPPMKKAKIEESTQ